jgi:hypothetical protein
MSEQELRSALCTDAMSPSMIEVDSMQKKAEKLHALIESDYNEIAESLSLLAEQEGGAAVHKKSKACLVC